MYFCFLYVPYIYVLPSIVPQVMLFAASVRIAYSSLTPDIVLHYHISLTFSPICLAVILRIWKQISPNSHTCLPNCVVPQHKRYLLSCTAVFLNLSDILDHLRTVTNCIIPSTILSVLLPQLVTTCISV